MYVFLNYYIQEERQKDDESFFALERVLQLVVG